MLDQKIVKVQARLLVVLSGRGESGTDSNVLEADRCGGIVCQFARHRHVETLPEMQTPRQRKHRSQRGVSLFRLTTSQLTQVDRINIANTHLKNKATRWHMPTGYKVETSLLRRLVEPQREPHVLHNKSGIHLIKSKTPSRIFLRKLGGCFTDDLPKKGCDSPVPVFLI